MTHATDEANDVLDGLLGQAVDQLRADAGRQLPPRELNGQVLDFLAARTPVLAFSAAGMRRNGTGRCAASALRAVRSMSAAVQQRRIGARTVGTVLSIAACIGLVVGVSILLSAGSQPAFAQMVDALQKVHSASYTISQSTGDGPAAVFQVRWLSDQRGRVEMPDGSYIVFDSLAQTMLEVDPQQATATVTEQLPVANGYSVLATLQAAKDSVAADAASLADREVAGVEASGLSATVDGVGYRVWVHPETHLPVRMETEHRRQTVVGPRTQPEQTVREVWTNFRYNLPLDEALFSLQPPEGYAVVVRSAPAAEAGDAQRGELEEQLRAAQETFQSR